MHLPAKYAQSAQVQVEYLSGRLLYLDVSAERSKNAYFINLYIGIWSYSSLCTIFISLAKDVLSICLLSPEILLIEDPSLFPKEHRVSNNY
jgi:hypothetical protein